MSSCLMVGPAYAIRFGKWTVDFRVVGGLYFAKAPDVRLQNDAAVPECGYKFNNNPYNCVGTLGYQGGCGIRYNCGKHVHVDAKATFTHASPSYTISYNTPTELGGQTTKNYTFIQNTSVLDFTFGIGYGFGE